MVNPSSIIEETSSNGSPTHSKASFAYHNPKKFSLLQNDISIVQKNHDDLILLAKKISSAKSVKASMGPNAEQIELALNLKLKNTTKKDPNSRS